MKFRGNKKNKETESQTELDSLNYDVEEEPSPDVPVDDGDWAGTDGYEDYGEDGYYDDEYYDDEYYDEEAPKKSLGRTVAYMLIVLVVAVGLAVGMWFAADDVLALTKPDNVITITIDPGDDLRAVTDNLADHGLVNYRFLFELYGRFSHAEDKIGAGTYELNQQFDYHALVNGLASNSEVRKTVTLTFPEGYTCDQMFDMLAVNGVCSLVELEDTAANYEFDYEFLADRPYGAANRLEGYLFPDTYDFYIDDDPERVINKMLSNFSGKLSDEMVAAIDDRNADIRRRMQEEGTFSEEEIENAMMDVYDILTVASLIEKEAGSDQERGLISSVIYNRLTTHVHELLQVDATVEYALGEHRAELTANDLAIDNPYNTYKYKGLPPGPIANPGLASITAAIYPKDSDYFFYALDTGGVHRFFETYMEQQDFLHGVTAEEPEETQETQETPESEPTPEENPEGEPEETGEEPENPEEGGETDAE